MLDNGTDLGDLPPGTTTNAYMVTNTNPLGFHCKLHSSMVGNINAATAPVPPPCTDPYGYGC